MRSCFFNLKESALKLHDLPEYHYKKDQAFKYKIMNICSKNIEAHELNLVPLIYDYN